MADQIQIVLDNARAQRARIYANPLYCIVAYEPNEVSKAFTAMEAARASGKHLAGYFSYELGYVLEPKLARLLPSKRNVPLLWFGVFDDANKLKHGAVETYLNENTCGRAYAGPLKHGWDEPVYRPRFNTVHDFIEAGDIYQANLSFRSFFSFVGDPWALYRDLRAQSLAAHNAFICDGERHVLSLSPELFFRISPDGDITAKPMKGTAPRGGNKQSDTQLREQLAKSPKDRAENLMIVDLLRNDIGRIAETGSVRVSDPFFIESYPTTHQMVSTVRAHLRPSQSIAQIIRALFPCGSVTGAPKIRAMEIIAEEETDPRGIYCGAIGYFAPEGSAEFNVAIRTLTIANGRGELGIGGAVVHDSHTNAEFAECLLKARYYEAARRPLELIETLRFSPPSDFHRLDRHIARLANSAKVFGIPFLSAYAEAALHATVQNAAVDLRVRLSLQENGELACMIAPLPAEKASWTFAISKIRVARRDLLLQYKTSWREIYERGLENAGSCDEVLFINELGHVTEGSRTNVFIQCDGQLCTPPVSDGLLNGCLRQELLARGVCVERSITLHDLARATEIYFGNSLRGLIPAHRAIG